MTNVSSMACGLAAVTLAAVAARAGETPVDISGLMNEPWTFSGAPGGASIINGNTFPTGSQIFGGVPFDIPAGPNNYWNGAAAAGFGSGVVSLTIPVGVYGVTSAFTLLNTLWGWPGPAPYLSVTFTGSNGATANFSLVGNVNVRDYNQDGNTNTINHTSTVAVWQNGLGQRLDRQEFILPPAFYHQTLTSVTITDTGDQGNGTNGSRAVFSGLTVSTCLAYVAPAIKISSSQIVYDPHAGLYFQKVALTNTGSTAFTGPLFFILTSLPSAVALVNQSALTGCFTPVGSPYIVALPGGSVLAPNTSVVLKLGFDNPSGAAITYSPLAAGSLGANP